MAAQARGEEARQEDERSWGKESKLKKVVKMCVNCVDERYRDKNVRGARATHKCRVCVHVCERKRAGATGRLKRFLIFLRVKSAATPSGGGCLVAHIYRHGNSLL